MCWYWWFGVEYFEGRFEFVFGYFGMVCYFY